MDDSLLLIRHAAPRLGWEAPYNVRPGPPLSELGCRQAAELGAFLARRQIGRIVSSPFDRALQTARIAAARVGCSVEELPDLAEGGPGENDLILRTRVVRGLGTIMGWGDPKEVAVVSHGTPVRMILESLVSDRHPLAGHVYDYGNPVPPGGVWEARREGDRWRLELVFVPSERLPDGAVTDGGAFGARIAR